MVRVTIIGASGYAGAELIRILANHKNCKIVHLVAKGSGGKTLGEIFPALGYLADLQDMIVEDVDNESLMADCAFIDEADVVFTALPHGASAPFIRRCMEKNIKAIDLGADFRFRDVDTYEEWYGKHTYPEICKENG